MSENSILEIIKPGLQSSIQGNYRYHLLEIGIPVSGPMDEFSHHAGNLLVGNDKEAPSIEYAMIGGTYRFLKDSVIALTGAECQGNLNGEPLRFWETLEVHTGDILEIGAVITGARGYMAVAGGFDVPSVFGSTSTYATGFIGGFRGRYLSEGDILPAVSVKNLENLKNRYIPKAKEYFAGGVTEIPITKGPQFDYFTDDCVEEFLETEWKVSFDCNRTACRFSGMEFRYKDFAYENTDGGPHPSNIINDGTSIGAMQTPGGAEIICFGKDTTSMGGFTKIGVVVMSAYDILGQLMPLMKVKWKFITLEEAYKMQQEYLNRYNDLVQTKE